MAAKSLTAVRIFLTNRQKIPTFSMYSSPYMYDSVPV